MEKVFAVWLQMQNYTEWIGLTHHYIVPLIRKPTFGDGSNLYCMKIAMLYLVVEKQCQVINISQSAFGVEVRCNASNNNDDAINVINNLMKNLHHF